MESNSSKKGCVSWNQFTLWQAISESYYGGNISDKFGSDGSRGTGAVPLESEGDNIVSLETISSDTRSVGHQAACKAWSLNNNDN